MTKPDPDTNNMPMNVLYDTMKKHPNLLIDMAEHGIKFDLLGVKKLAVAERLKAEQELAQRLNQTGADDE